MVKTETYADAGVSKFAVTMLVVLGAVWLVFFSALLLGGLAVTVASLYALLNDDTSLWPVLGIVLGPSAVAFAIWRFRNSD